MLMIAAFLTHSIFSYHKITFMQPPNYKESLAEAMRTLVEVNERLYDSMLYIETQGELSP